MQSGERSIGRPPPHDVYDGRHHAPHVHARARFEVVVARMQREKGMSMGGGEATNSPYLRTAADTLCANIGFAEVDGPLKTLAVVSAMAGDGKSTVALAMARCYAALGNRTLIVECDVRRRTVARRLGVRPVGISGLQAVVLGRASLDDAATSTGEPGLWLLDAEAGIKAPSKLLGSKRFESLVHHLAEVWDYVIFDTPPLGAFVDGALVGAAADATVLVARQNHTERRALRAAHDQLTKAGANVVGVVLNAADQDSLEYYGRPEDRQGAHASDSAKHGRKLWGRRAR